MPGHLPRGEPELVLIDHQKEMFEVIRSETNAGLVELNVRPLASSGMKVW